MTPVEISEALKEARKKKILSLGVLDALLENDETFDGMVERLNRRVHDFAVEVPEVRGEPGGPDRTLKSPPHYSSGGSAYFLYIQEVRGRKRMTRKEEYALAKRMEFFKSRVIRAVRQANLPRKECEFFLQNTSCIGRPDSADVGPLCAVIGKCPRGKRDIIHSNCRAYNACRSIFVERNLYLVVNLTQPYRTYGVPVMDLIQEGNTALIRAVEKYDWRKGVRFQTYASFWVRQAVERLISANKGIVRVPNYIQQKMRRLKREGRLSRNMGSVTARDISDAFEMNDEAAGRLLETERGHVSLDVAPSGEDGASLADLVADEHEEFVPPDEIETLRKRLDEALDQLTEQEKLIIRHRFGLARAELKTLDELGEMMSVSRERVRQVQLRALQKLKKPHLLENLQSFL